MQMQNLIPNKIKIYATNSIKDNNVQTARWKKTSQIFKSNLGLIRKCKKPILFSVLHRELYLNDLIQFKKPRSQQECPMNIQRISNEDMFERNAIVFVWFLISECVNCLHISFCNWFPSIYSHTCFI